MPVVGIPVDMLLERIATPLEREQLVEHLLQLGCDVEGYATLRRFRCQRCDNILEITETENPPVVCDRCAADVREQSNALLELGRSEVVRMELRAVRPDMFDPGGLARVLRHYLDERSEPERYELAPPSYSVRVDASLARSQSYRPSIACAIVRGIHLNDDAIKVVMKLQENLHWALGRDRKHASIGVYDLDTISGPQLVYRTVGRQELRFTPLGYDAADDAAALTPQAVLEQHPKGKAYARLLADFDRYPLLCDAAGQVLSMPPIINSEQTRVTQRTRDFFVDVTGTGDRIVSKALNILVTSLAEILPGVTIERVTIVRDSSEQVTPNLTPQTVVFDPEHAARTIGVSLSTHDVMRHLRRMGHGVARDKDGAALVVSVPAYRNDIMHSIDLVEDLAIAYGYDNIQTELVPTMTVASEQPMALWAATARQAMTGLGFAEVLTLILSSEQQQYDALRLPWRDDRIVIDNPIGMEQTIVRTSLLPGLLDTFSVNTDHEMPQRIFEVGDISLVDTGVETGAREQKQIAGGVMGPRADYAEIRSACEALLRELGWRLIAEPIDSGCFIAGRGARAVACRGQERLPVGTMGEVHPQVLEHFKLVQPGAVFEVNLAALLRGPV